MSGVWVFKNNGVMHLVETSGEVNRGGASSERKVLVHLTSGQAVSSHMYLDQILRGLGWERYYDGDSDFIQYHKHSSIDLISLPKDSNKFSSICIYDIVVKNPNIFHVRDI